MKCQILCCTGQMGNFISPCGRCFHIVIQNWMMAEAVLINIKLLINSMHASLSVMATVVTYVQFEDIKIVMLHRSVTFYFCSITVCTGACRHTIKRHNKKPISNISLFPLFPCHLTPCSCFKSVH